MMQLALGPVQYLWPRDSLLAFYDAVAASPVDIVYLGEVVCARRHEMRLPDWLALAARLRAAGKQVVLSTQALLESTSDVGAMQKVARNGDFMVEANDMGAVRALAGHGPFVAGPHLNLYNAEALAWVAELGATRWVPPVEMRRDDLAVLQAVRPASLGQTELFAFGRLPLAFSARCFTARHHDLPKDDCRFLCGKDPDGLLLSTREGRPFLALNGIQTQSAGVHCLAGDFDGIRTLGIEVLRLSPQSRHMPAILAMFDDLRRGALAPADAQDRLSDLACGVPCNGYWHGEPGMAYHPADLPA